MTWYEHLLTWPRERLAKELAAAVRENVKLRDRVGQLEHELFWLRVAERKED